MTIVAHLSDTHVDGTAGSAGRVRTVMGYLDAIPYDLDAVLVTGDIVDNGQPAEYEQAREVLASRHPVAVLPGNHDERAAFRAVLLAEPGGDGPVNQVFRTRSGATIALCDSIVPGKPDGYLAEETLDWLAGVLDTEPPDTPVLIACHHPPVDLGNPPIDAMRQFGEQRLASLVTAHPNVAGLLCGHAHTAAATTFAGRPLRVAPGVASTLRMPWEHDGSSTLADTRFPPGLAFHTLSPAGHLTTHYRLLL